ncbi:Fungal specific transcription factor domain family protein [Clavispora lusitaniae]|uniref:Fungal specific transcription factor domain family protein n=1 Tax=Clavispora lusitaniae TaxID=36911 RepID=UPI00202C3419|nr:Fungal specific transcription factor domain family protein [Clavispora lusitaniae]
MVTEENSEMAVGSTMDLYYNRDIGNGMVTSKFRINSAARQKTKHSSGHDESASHSLFNCSRCYKLKKRCSRDKPVCSYCSKTGADCEYVERVKKRPRKELGEKDGEGKSGQNSISIASLVHAAQNQDSKRQGDEQFHNIDLPSTVDIQSRNTPDGNARAGSRPVKSLNRKLLSSAFRNGSKQNLHEEYLVVKAIPDENLPSAFMHTFFANYEWKYPFLNMPGMMKKCSELSFVSETFVNLDVYLVLSVGCIIYDANNDTRHFSAYFSDSLIESIVDMISYDFSSKEDLPTAHLLILLAVYAINVSNVRLAWNIVGFLNRLIIYLTDFNGSSKCTDKRSFWTIYNLDKELSLLLGKPSQFIPTKLITVSDDFSDSLVEGEAEPLARLMKQSLVMYQLQDRMLHLRLGLAEATEAALYSFSSDLEKWRVEFSSIVHSEYADSHLLPNFIGLINLDYYFLSIELDQISSTESSQFTLQFLSNSFSLLLTTSDKKGSVGTSLYSLFWFQKLFKVISYNLEWLVRTFTKKDISSVKLAEFNSNIQLMINLLKLLINSNSVPQHYIGKLKNYVSFLSGLSIKLMGSNGASDEFFGKLADEVKDMITSQ